MSKPTVYVLRDIDGNALYVGMSERWPRRLVGHRSKPYYDLVHSADVDSVHEGKRAALDRERELIRDLAPPFNVLCNPQHDPQALASLTEDSEPAPEHREGLAERLRTAREAAGLTNAELAGRIGATRKSVERWQTAGESGAGSLKADTLFALAAALDVDPTWLLVGDHEVVG